MNYDFSYPSEFQKDFPGFAERNTEAKEAYKVWEKNPFDISLNFKQVHPSKPVYSVRVTLNWRALGIRDPKNTVTWFWIGSHEEYNNLVKQLKR